MRTYRAPGLSRRSAPLTCRIDSPDQVLSPTLTRLNRMIYPDNKPEAVLFAPLYIL